MASKQLMEYVFVPPVPPGVTVTVPEVALPVEKLVPMHWTVSEEDHVIRTVPSGYRGEVFGVAVIDAVPANAKNGKSKKPSGARKE